jgi:hypothetical protein
MARRVLNALLGMDILIIIVETVTELPLQSVQSARQVIVLIQMHVKLAT